MSDLKYEHCIHLNEDGYCSFFKCDCVPENCRQFVCKAGYETMYLEAESEFVIRNMDTVKCKIRSTETDDIQEFSFTDLTETEQRHVLCRCQKDELCQMEAELISALETVIEEEQPAEIQPDDILYHKAYIMTLARMLREFGDTFNLVYNDDTEQNSEEEQTEE